MAAVIVRPGVGGSLAEQVAPHLDELRRAERTFDELYLEQPYEVNARAPYEQSAEHAGPLTAEPAAERIPESSYEQPYEPSYVPAQRSAGPPVDHLVDPPAEPVDDLASDAEAVAVSYPDDDEPAVDLDDARFVPGPEPTAEVADGEPDDHPGPSLAHESAVEEGSTQTRRRTQPDCSPSPRTRRATAGLRCDRQRGDEADEAVVSPDSDPAGPRSGSTPDSADTVADPIGPGQDSIVLVVDQFEEVAHPARTGGEGGVPGHRGGTGRDQPGDPDRAGAFLRSVRRERRVRRAADREHRS